MPKVKKTTARPRKTTPRAAAAKQGAPASLTDLQNGSLSVLELEAVRPSTAAGYRRHAARFVEWCRAEGHNWTDLMTLDLILVTYFSHLFMDGLDSATGASTVAAIRFLLPRLVSPKLFPLPRAERALRGWKALVPPAQRLPVPRAVAGAIAGVMMNWNLPLMALCVLMSFAAYLRPGECHRLKGRDLVPPQPHAGRAHRAWGLIVNNAEDGRPGKTGVTDEAIMMDKTPWLDSALAALRSIRGETQDLWDFTMDEFRQKFYQAVELLSLDNPRPHLYSLRHGGASRDLLTETRTMAEVKLRGRWQTDKSLRRYGKATRLQAAIAALPAGIFAYGEHVVENLGSLLIEAHRRGPGAVPPPRRV